MTTEQSLPSTTAMASTELSHTVGQNRPPRHRRGPRRPGRGGLGTAIPVTAAPVPGNTLISDQPESSGSEGVVRGSSSSIRGSRSRRAGGRGGRGAGRGGGQLTVNGRAFGGQLTSDTSAISNEGSLAGDAPEFVPGQPMVHRSRPAQARDTRPRRLSKSQAPDIATRTHEDITNGQYECVICTNEVLPNSKVWSCKTCWSVLHLSCVRKWSKNEVSTHQQRADENGELPPPRQWRCPGCNLPKEDLPEQYTCWCTKEFEPRSIAGLPPHSCGQTCAKPRAGQCPHPCELICHAGPCPPCHHMGPLTSCFCGKQENSRRCVDTNYESGWSCGQICGDLLPCGEHECQQECHEGLCGSCDVMLESRCFCGKEEKSLPCSDRQDEKESQHNGESWMGSFDCGAQCRRPFDCGQPEHFCESTCHPQDVVPAHCPFSPDLVEHCPCGKTPISALLDTPRKDCSDPIPYCKETCQKPLSCGHLCQKTCHNGDCGMCRQTVDISCRCGRTSSRTLCHQGSEEAPQCARVCRATLNCGRHQCGERCCAGEKKASDRQSSKKKHQAFGTSPPRSGDENIESEHICLKICGRPLKCGNHTCESLCHKGPCSSCLEAVFEEISCACGRTVLQPPQPCGTRPPDCRFDCTRQQTCGHPQIKHQCHENDEACPKCPFLMEKSCICGKKTLKNQPCWFSEVRCGLPCGKKLKCGIHFCQKLCHRQGQCEDASSPCSQLCGRRKTVCDHTCADTCHAPYPCKEITPCQAKTFITCECQHQKQPMKCLASKTSPGNSLKSLECNDECLKLQRNAKLAAALNIDPATHVDEHIPYSTSTLSFFSSHQKFAQQYEREFRVFATDEGEKRLRFKPMQAHQRSFLHSLAEDFGFDSESQDPEPHRHVSIFKTPRFVSAPNKTLSQCVRAKPVEVPVANVAKPLVTNAEPWNAFLLVNPKFGLTIDELQAELKPELGATDLGFEISFLPSGDVVLHAKSTGSWFNNKEANLINLKVAVSKKISSLSLAGATLLCAVDSSLNILRREEVSASSNGGWSQVAKGVSGMKRVQQESVGRSSSFTILGKLKKAEKEKEREKVVEKKKVVAVADDWEKEVEGWDQDEPAKAERDSPS